MCKIHIRNLTRTVKHSAQSPSLLHTLESENIDVQYHCREGFCGACRATLVSGDVDYPNEPLAYIRDGEVLLCCAKIDQDIEIDVL